MFTSDFVCADFNVLSNLVFVCGNGGANPRHANLFARDVPPSRVIRILDRFIIYYIRTADKLTRTARWLESMEGGIEVRCFQFLFSMIVVDVATPASAETSQGDLGR